MWLILLAYFLCAEIIPLMLMLKVFNSSAASGTETKHALRQDVLLSNQMDNDRNYSTDYH
jgi:hypothetical protein